MDCGRKGRNMRQLLPDRVIHMLKIHVDLFGWVAKLRRNDNGVVVELLFSSREGDAKIFWGNEKDLHDALRYIKEVMGCNLKKVRC